LTAIFTICYSYIVFLIWIGINNLCFCRSLISFNCSSNDPRSDSISYLLCYDNKNRCYYDGCNYVYFINGSTFIWTSYNDFPKLNNEYNILFSWCNCFWILLSLWYLIDCWWKIMWGWFRWLLYFKHITLLRYNSIIFAYIIIIISIVRKWMIIYI